MNNRVYIVGQIGQKHYGMTLYPFFASFRKIIHPVAKDLPPVDDKKFLYKCPECGKKVANPVVMCGDCRKKLQKRGT